MEDLNFKQLKTRMLYRPKKQNEALSSFAYKKILEKVERKCLMNEVDVIKVDPKNTSKIGKEKYTKSKRQKTFPDRAKDYSDEVR